MTPSNTTSDFVTEGSLVVTPKPENGADCELYMFLVYVSLICTLCVVGLVGNSLTLAVLYREKYKSSSAFLLRCLAVSDIMVLICWTLVQAPQSLLYLTKSNTGVVKFLYKQGAVLYLVVEPLCTMTHTMTTWLVVMVTWQRYVAVCMPYKVHSFGSKKVARIQAAVVFLGSILVNLPRFFERRLVRSYYTSLRVEPFAHTDLYQKFYKLGFYYAFIYAIPLACLLFMTIRLIQTLKTANRKRQEMTSQKKFSQDLTLSLVIVVIIFIICQLFNPIRRILFLLTPWSPSQCADVLTYFTPWVIVAVNFNSAVNFFIFILFRPRFRQSLLKVLRCNPVTQVHPNITQSAGSSTQGAFSLNLLKSQNNIQLSQVSKFDSFDIQ